jgi:hypothetical protein
MRDSAAKDPLVVLERVEPATARRLIEVGIDGSHDWSKVDLAEGYTDHRAIALARCRALPEPDEPPAPVQVSEAERVAIVEEFLASPEAQGLPPEAERLARIVVDFGADDDLGRPLRVSPAKTDMLFNWCLAHDDSIDAAHQAALGVVYTAWVRWAAARTGLPEATGDELAETVEECVEHFAETHARTMEEAKAFAARYLDGDAGVEPEVLGATMQRRLFAVPADEASEPANPAQRRNAIAREHGGGPFGPEGKAHVAMHATLATQLWYDDPPEVWSAARRLLEAGANRHETLHTIGELLAVHSQDAEIDVAAYRKALDALGRDPAGG